jgi:4-amino-4-deoxy-L-arabinose transferase-like glycosyltransferase
VRFAVCWLVPTWLMFEILPTKLIHYELPAYGALAMLMAAAVRAPLGAGPADRRGPVGVRRPGPGRRRRLWPERVRDRRRPGLDHPGRLLALAAGIAGAVLLLRHHSVQALVAAGALGIGAHVALTAGLIPRLEPLFLSKDVADALDRTKLSPRSGAAGSRGGDRLFRAQPDLPAGHRHGADRRRRRGRRHHPRAGPPWSRPARTSRSARP